MITGHTGFKGAWLTKILLNWGADISGIALKPPTNPNLFEILKLKKEIHNHIADIRSFKKVKDIIKKEKPEIIFHLAAQPMVRASYDDPLYTYETNTLGTANILEAIRSTKTVKSAVIITTDKVYENFGRNYCYKEDDKLGGYDPYSASKASAEIVASSYIKSFFNPEFSSATLIATARAGNVIGGGDWGKDRLVPDLIKAIFRNKKLTLRNPNATRPWQFVLEPLYGYLLLAQKLYERKKEFSGVWNFGPNNKNNLNVKELTEKSLEIFNKGSYAIKGNANKKHEAQSLKLDSNKARRLLGWRPKLSLNETLKLTFDWYKYYYDKKNIGEITDKQIKLFFEH